jgi:demethylmenaquinone methyltransferase/2-methoxy-6-polyprenyl-1,4-benzoquinol methylase
MSTDEYRSHTIRFFDRWARVYDPFVSLFRLGPLRSRVVEMSGVGQGDRVLDVCTGTGAQALEFARRCDDVTAVDLSAGMLAVAQKKNKTNRVRFLQMDATTLGFADKAFDASSISLGLHDMPPKVREEVLREMARVTKGNIIIVDYRPPRSRVLRAVYIALVSLYESKYFPDFMRSDFGELLARCGLKNEREEAVWPGLLRICICDADGP